MLTILFPGREKYHAWCVDDASQRDLALGEAIRRVYDMHRSIDAWAYYDRRELIRLLKTVMHEKCRIFECSGEGLQIDTKIGSDGCQFRIMAGTWPEKS